MILRKYLSWLSSTTILVIVSSLILPKGLGEIADWIGPLLGPTFRPELYLIFLVLGPSLSYAPLLVAWVAAGIVGGFFARGVGRSIAAGTLSIITIGLLMVANGFLLVTGITKLFGGGLSGFNIPPPPQGLSLADILNTPLVGQTVQAVVSGGGNPLLILESLVTNFILNIALYAASFIVSGFIFSKIFHRRRPKVRRKDPLPAEPAPTRPVAQPLTQPMPTLPSQPPVSTIVIALAILLLLVSSIILPLGFAQSSGSSSGPTGEHLSLNLQKDGTLKMIYSTNVSSLPGVPTDYARTEFQGLVGGFLLTFNGSIDLGQGGSGGSAGSGGSLSFLLPLLPKNGFLAIYAAPDTSTGKARADVLASEFGQGFGENLVSTVSMELPSFGGQQTPSGGIYLGIYAGDGQAGAVATRVLSLVQGTGVGSILTPQKVFISQFGIQAGFINFDFQNTTATPSFTPSVQVTADLTPLGNFYGRGNFTLGLREILGSQGTIGPSSTGRTTDIQLGFPANSTVTGYSPSNATLNTPPTQLDYSMNSTSQPVSNVYVNFTSTFPQRIDIDRQLDPQSPVASGSTITERVTVKNLGNQTIQGVVVSEKALFQTYPTLELISPGENVSLGDIQANSAGNSTIQFKVNSDGFYTLPPTVIAYRDQGQTISKQGPQSYIQSSFNLQLYLKDLMSGTSPYSYIFLLLVVLPPLLQLRRILRRSRTPKNSYKLAPAGKSGTNTQIVSPNR